MFKTAMIIAVLSPSVAFAAVSVPATDLEMQQLNQYQSASLVGTDRADVFERLSMGPDPGGKTGATVTPETTKTGQPSVDGTAASKQSGASGEPAPAVARDSTDPSTGLASRADALKQQRDSTATQPRSTSSTSPSTPGQSR
jgi:hypothetical protein